MADRETPEFWNARAGEEVIGYYDGVVGTLRRAYMKTFEWKGEEYEELYLDIMHKDGHSYETHFLYHTFNTPEERWIHPDIKHLFHDPPGATPLRVAPGSEPLPSPVRE